MSTERQVQDVVETLRKAHGRKTGCVLLIGAGCSKAAGIPLASEFVEIIKNEYPEAYKYANPNLCQLHGKAFSERKEISHRPVCGHSQD